ncbi:MAG: PAS domain-containing protein [Piscinibacter sp.]|nr:PAS domain-containing protein [Piscinibacter sp.]
MSEQALRARAHQPGWPHWLILGNVAVMALVVLLSGVALQTGLRSFERRAQDATENLARSLSQAIEAELDRVDMVLRAVVVEHTRSGADPRRLPDILEDQFALIGRLDTLRATDSTGIVRGGRDTAGLAPIDVSDRSNFIQARDDPTPRLLIIGPNQTRVSKKWAIMLARRLNKPDGSFDGIVYANVTVERFLALFGAVNLGREGAISLRMLPDLKLVARQTSQGPDASGVGTSRVSEELRQTLATQPESGSYLAKTALDQIERANAYRRLENYPLLILVGLGTKDFLTPWYGELVVVVALCGLTAAILFASTWLVLRARRRELASRTALQDNEAFLDRTGRIAAVGGWELDIASHTLTWSAQTCRLLDVPIGSRPSLDEGLGFVAPEARAQVGEHLQNSIAHGTSWMLELPLVTAAGRALWVRAVAEVESERGKPVRVIGAVQDITEQHARKQELEREQALRAQVEHHARELDAMVGERGEMLDVLAHEVRQPLNNASAALQSAATVLAEVHEPAASLRLSRAQSVMHQVLGRLDNTLAVASLLARPDPIERGDADVDALVAVAVADMPAEQRGRVHVERATSTRTVSMDMSLMRLALRNLLSNALKYGPPGTPVKVRLSDSDHPLALVIDVTDAGPGIPADLVPRLFERGARGAPNGHGLGLYIVRRVMELHESRVEIAANQPGRVTLRLVVVQAPAE